MMLLRKRSEKTRLSLAVLIVTVISSIMLGVECIGVDYLPPLRDLDGRPRPDRDRFQAIVPAYRFQCPGRVSQWIACVGPSGTNDHMYYIQFQVWRPSKGINGCYSLVGFNSPLNDDGTDGFLNPSANFSDPLSRCVTLSVPQDQQFNIREGDVIGYYVDRFRNDRDRDDGGIQWDLEDSNVVVYHKDQISREERMTQYAVAGQTPAACGFQIFGDNDTSLYSLNNSTSAAPIINLTFVEFQPQVMTTTESTTLTFYHTVSHSMSPASHPITTLNTASLTMITDNSSSIASFSSLSPAISPSCSAPGYVNCSEQSDSINIKFLITITGTVTLLIIFMASLATSLLVVMSWRRRRRKKKIQRRKSGTQLRYNDAYMSHNHERNEDGISRTIYSDLRPNSGISHEVYYSTAIMPAADTASDVVYTTITDISNEGLFTMSENVSYNTTGKDRFITSENISYGLDSDAIPATNSPSYTPIDIDSDVEVQYDYIVRLSNT